MRQRLKTYEQWLNVPCVSLRSTDQKCLMDSLFEGGYTNTVSAGDGDFTTADTLWDFKVSKMPVKKENTLQLLMYWRMGLHSIHPEFLKIKYLESS